MKLHRRLAVVLILVLSLTLATFTGVVQGQAVKNPDTFVYQSAGDVETLDPAWEYDTTSSATILWNIYETLIFFRGGRTDLYDPMLASEVPSLQNGGISADGKTFTFKIRQGVKFHDGTPMTAEDVKYSLLRIMLTDRDAGPSWLLLAPILGFDVQSTRDDKGNLIPDIFDRADRAIQVQGNTLVITLTKPYAGFLSILATWSPVVSKKFVAANGGWDGQKATMPKYNNLPKPDQMTLFDKANGTGPFKLERWDRGTKTVTLIRNDDYWRTPAKLRRIVLQNVEEFGPRRLALQNGDADMIALGGLVNLPAVQGLPGVRVVDDLPQLGNSPALFFTYNIDGEGNADIGSGKLDGNGIPANFFSDIHVRRAFAYLVDRQAFIDQAYRGKGRVANGPIPFGMLGYAPRGKWYEVSKDKAIAEFKEAWGGQVWDKGFKFTLSFNTGNIARQTLTQMVKEAVEGLNPKFKIDTRGITWSTYLQLQAKRKLPMFALGWAADYPDPDNFTTPFMHSTGTFSGPQGYRNPEVDRLIEQAGKEPDPKKREQAYLKLQELAYQDIPTIYLRYSVGTLVLRSWVKGWYNNPMFAEGYEYAYRFAKGQ
jgi:peptide/nickel transport system substrate-binding protein